MIVGILALSSLSPFVTVAEAAPDVYHLRNTVILDGHEMTTTAGAAQSSLIINSIGLRCFYTEVYPTEGGDASIADGQYGFVIDYKKGTGGGANTITFTAQVGLIDDAATVCDDASYTQFGESSSFTTMTAGGKQTAFITICITCAAQTIPAADPKRLVLRINVTAVSGSGIKLLYNGTSDSSDDSQLLTPLVVVPEYGALLIPFAVLLPPFLFWRMKRRKLRRSEVRIHE
jgi:hypothetical protein